MSNTERQGKYVLEKETWWAVHFWHLETATQSVDFSPVILHQINCKMLLNDKLSITVILPFI